MKRKPLPRWTPFERQSHYVDGAGVSRSIPDDRMVFRNSRYQVEIRGTKAEPFGRILWLSLKRIDRSPVHDWRELQRIKNELVGPGIEGVEIYPAESRLVDTSNQYHLWCFVDGFKLPFGFRERLVTDSKSSHPALSLAKQRPFDDDNRPADLADAATIDEMLKQMAG